MIYISYTTEFHDCAVKVFNDLKQKQHNVSMWNPNGRYERYDLYASDTVIFIIKDFKFCSEYENLSLGVAKELAIAYNQKKNIKVAYITKDSSLKYYNAHLSVDKNGKLIFGGVVGSGLTRISDVPHVKEVKEQSDDDYLLL